MRVTRQLALALALLGIATSPAAAATILNVADLGLTAPHANYGCPAGSANCLTAMDYQLAAPADATGSFTINDAGTLATISLDIASVTFGSVPSGGPDAVFTGVHYAASVTVTALPGFVLQLMPGTGTVSGLLNGNPFSTPASVTNLQCTGTQCAVTFGGPSYAVDGHQWLNTFDVVIPEPSLALLALFGAAALTLRRR